LCRADQGVRGSSTNAGGLEMVMHGNLEMASRVSGVRLAECLRRDHTVVVFKIRVVENIENVPGKVNEVGMLLLRENPPAFRHAKIEKARLVPSGEA
jgi:hypothetical protein